VSIPDVNLEARIRAELGKSTGEIKRTDMESLTRLAAKNQRITDLTGLKYAANLDFLDLVNTNLNDTENLISDLNPLAGLTRLAVLDLSENQISDPGSLAPGSLPRPTGRWWWRPVAVVPKAGIPPWRSFAGSTGRRSMHLRGGRA
jgi:hypothetical protein